MKNFNKILVVLLAIAVITTTFVFSASAEDTLPNWNGKDLTGTTWVLNSNVTLPSDDTTYSINFTSYDITRQYVKLRIANWTVSYISSSGGTDSASSSNSIKEQCRTVIFTGGTDSTNSNLIKWLLENASITSHTYVTVCDGSTCPATDVNLDNVCDDCGLTFSMLREFTPSDFPSGYPSVPSVASDARYYLYSVQASGSTYIVVYPSTVTPTYDTTKQNGYLTFSESYGSYRLTDNEWVLNNDDSPYSIGGTNNNSVDVLYSSVPIKDENGENFFPIPLWEKVEKVTQGEIPQLSQSLGGNLMTLTLCGVGCLTLLMALVLLSKTFRIFLVK